MTSAFSPSIQTSQPSSSSIQPNGQIKVIQGLLSSQQKYERKNSRHVINCNHMCYKSSSNTSLSNDMTHSKALLLSPPLPIRRRPTNIFVTSHDHLKSSTSRSLSSSYHDRRSVWLSSATFRLLFKLVFLHFFDVIIHSCR
ncbi:unnamed protein product [Heterobilharzia americana]|nr:unnamed protein product [Heterobilharzia americana]